MRIVALILALCLVNRSANADGSSPAERFEHAVDQMLRGDWQGASAELAGLVDEGILSGPILLNLAFSLEQTGALGEARWVLARAEALPDVAAEARRRGHALDRALRQPLLETAGTADYMPWVWLAGLFIMSASLLATVFNPRFRPGIVAGAAAIVFALAASALPVRHPAIVIVDSAAFSDHQSLAEPEFSVSEGQAVRLTGRRGARVEVVTQGGLRGWVDVHSVRTF